MPELLDESLNRGEAPQRLPPLAVHLDVDVVADVEGAVVLPDLWKEKERAVKKTHGVRNFAALTSQYDSVFSERTLSLPPEAPFSTQQYVAPVTTTEVCCEKINEGRRKGGGGRGRGRDRIEITPEAVIDS